MSNSIKQEVRFSGDPTEVYELLMNSQQHAKFSGAPADVSSKVGGKVSCYGGQINAINVELVPGCRIVQAWRAADWEEGEYSITTFTLAKDGEQTRLTFTQNGVPEHCVDKISNGWKNFYWEPMESALRGG